MKSKQPFIIDSFIENFIQREIYGQNILLYNQYFSYNHLLQMIQPIIPSTYQNQTNPSNSDTNEGIVRGILGTTREMIDKIDDPQRQADLRKVLVKGRGLLNPQHQYEGLRSSASHRIKDEDRDELLKEFTGILKAPAENINSMAKAPFSKLGEDTFEDVDHQILAMEIKRLAITLKEYLQSRMKEGNEEKSEEYESDDEPLSRNEFYRDSVLAQMTLQLAKLHRAVLKNHHHLLILIGNFAGNAKNAREHKGNNETGNVKD